MRAALAAAAAALALTAPPVAAAAPAPGYYGVTSATELSRGEFERMAAGGVATLRVPFHWGHIEPRPPAAPPLPGLPGDDGRWAATDALVERAARHGVRVLPFVYGTPGWVADDPERPPIDDAAAREAWREFLTALVDRYGPGGELWAELNLLEPEVEALPVTAWQIWNEANSPVFWHPRPSAREFRELVALSAEAIRAADPAATVVLGGMFGSPTRGVQAWRFLRRFLAADGAAATFDAYAAHPYAPGLAGVAGQVNRMRRAVEASPAAGAPLWITEIGWPTDGPPGFAMVKSESAQKRLLARSYRLFERRAAWKVERVVWYVWRDNDVQADCTVCRYSGLFTRELEAKPAWRKLAQLAGGTP